MQVAHWIWWWQCLWHCRPVWSLPCHFATDVGGLALSIAKSHCKGALRSTHKSCTHGHVSWKRGGRKRELVAAPWTSSKWFSDMLWLEVHSHRLLRACFLGSKRKLRPPACQSDLGLPSVVCCPRGVQFPCTVYICIQGPLSSAWAHCFFFVHQVLAAIAEDAVAAHSRVTDGHFLIKKKKKRIFSIKFVHAHLQYTCNIYAMFCVLERSNKNVRSWFHIHYLTTID